jgi:hypothetical protein
MEGTADNGYWNGRNGWLPTDVRTERTDGGTLYKTVAHKFCDLL